MRNKLASVFQNAGPIAASVVVMLLISAAGWDAFVNGKLYYCTDGGSLDFFSVGDWVHHPESVPHVVSRPMNQPDEIKAGWSITGLWALWAAMLGGSVAASTLLARLLRRIHSPNLPPRSRLSGVEPSG